MSPRVVRRVVVPVAVAALVAAVVLGIFRLADPPGTAPGGTVGAAPGSGGGATGSSGTAADTPPSAGTPSADPDQPMSRFTSVRAGADGSSIDLRFWGGVDTCYRYRVQAEETSSQVSLRLQERNTHDGPCIDLAQQYERSVPLAQPLADRAVVDALTGEVLLSP